MTRYGNVSLINYFNSFNKVCHSAILTPSFASSGCSVTMNMGIGPWVGSCPTGLKGVWHLRNVSQSCMQRLQGLTRTRLSQSIILNSPPTVSPVASDANPTQQVKVVLLSVRWSSDSRATDDNRTKKKKIVASMTSVFLR